MSTRLFLRRTQQFIKEQLCDSELYFQGEAGKPGPPGDVGSQGLPVRAQLWLLTCASFM